MSTLCLQRVLVRAIILLLVSAIVQIASTEDTKREGRDSYLDAYVASHGSAPPPEVNYASPSQPGPVYAAPAPSYGPPRVYPHPPHHHLHHHAYGPPVVVGGGGDYGPDNGNGGGEMTGGSGGIDLATFFHAIGKILVVKLIIKLVAIIIALLLLPKIKEKKKKKKPSHKPHKPHYDDDSDQEDDEDDHDDDDDDRRKRALRSTVRGFGTSPGDPRILDLAELVLQSIESFTSDNDHPTSDMPTSDDQRNS